MYYKGIVVDKSITSYTVLTNDNRYVKVKNNYKADIGQKITFIKDDIVIKKQVNTVYKMGLVAAMFMIAILSVYSNYFKTSKAIAIVSIDINPSIQLYIDKDKNVVDLVALNNEGKELINVEYKGEKVDIVVDSIVNSAQHKKYLREDSNQVLITKTNLKSENIDIENEIISTLKKNDNLVGVELIYIEVKSEVIDKAKEKNQSIGTYSLDNEQVEKLTYKEVPIQGVLNNKDFKNNKSSYSANDSQGKDTDEKVNRKEAAKLDKEEKEIEKQVEKNNKEEEKEREEKQEQKGNENKSKKQENQEVEKDTKEYDNDDYEIDKHNGNNNENKQNKSQIQATEEKGSDHKNKANNRKDENDKESTNEEQGIIDEVEFDEEYELNNDEETDEEEDKDNEEEFNDEKEIKEEIDQEDEINDEEDKDDLEKIADERENNSKHNKIDKEVEQKGNNEVINNKNNNKKDDEDDEDDIEE